jgi:hypothetical protein
MFGNFQQSHLRIEVNASTAQIRDSLVCPAQFKTWLLPQTFSNNLPERLTPELVFTSWIGVIPIQHVVDAVDDQRLRLVLSQGIDGIHEWTWGEGWVQSVIEGISLLPINLGQTAGLVRLRSHLLFKVKHRTTQA